MQPSLLLSTVSLLQFSTFTTAHSAGHDFPIPRIFGGRTSLQYLPRHVIEEVQGYAAPHLQRGFPKRDVDSNKKCGSGVGFCDPGDWYVYENISLQSTMKAN